MGVRGLFPFLKKHNVPMQCVTREPWPIGSVIAVDVPIFVHKFIYVEKTVDGLQRRFLHFAETLQKTCTPIFVFDGAALPLKDREREKRNVARNKQLDKAQEKRVSEAVTGAIESGIEGIDILLPNVGISNSLSQETRYNGILWPTKHDYKVLRESLESRGHATRTAKYEAEALCAYLTKTNEAWATLSEDSDVLAFGATRAIFHYFDKPILVENGPLFAALDLTESQFRELCCLFGNDFIENVFNIGPVNAYKLLKKHGSWAIAYEACKYGWPTKTRESADDFQKQFPEVLTCLETSCFESVSSE